MICKLTSLSQMIWVVLHVTAVVKHLKLVNYSIELVHKHQCLSLDSLVHLETKVIMVTCGLDLVYLKDLSVKAHQLDTTRSVAIEMRQIAKLPEQQTRAQITLASECP